MLLMRPHDAEGRLNVNACARREQMSDEGLPDANEICISGPCGLIRSGWSACSM
jgi:hypothetical protein